MLLNQPVLLNIKASILFVYGYMVLETVFSSTDNNNNDMMLVKCH